MDEETRELLLRILALEEENNKMLHRMQRSNRWSAVMNLIYWAFIIGTSAAAYYYLQPILTNLLKQYEQITSSIKKAGNALPTVDPQTLQNINDTLKKLSPTQ